MKVAVMGATGTAGSKVVRRLKAKGADIVEVSRSNGVDLVSGDGLAAAVKGADAVIDASNAFPSGDSMDWGEALTAAARNVTKACAAQHVNRLVFLSISGVENPAFDDFPYYVAKREQEKIVRDSGLDATIVKSTQWFEFSANPAVVTFHDDRIEVQDWLVQPIAADTVADVLVHEAMQPSGGSTVVITGPERIHLPELTARRQAALGDGRTVQTIAPPLEALSKGALVAPPEAEVLGPGVDAWLASLK